LFTCQSGASASTPSPTCLNGMSTPLAMVSASPPVIEVVPSVAINGLMWKRAIAMPLTQPHPAPAARVTTSAPGMPRLWFNASVKTTAPSGTVPLTDRSNPPLTMASV
jgi:hypothetical protein